MRKKDSSRAGGFKVSYFFGEGPQGKKEHGYNNGEFFFIRVWQP